MMTKHLDSSSVALMMAKLCLIPELGRPSIAPQVAEDDDGLLDQHTAEEEDMEVNSLQVLEWDPADIDGNAENGRPFGGAILGSDKFILGFENLNFEFLN